MPTKIAGFPPPGPHTNCLTWRIMLANIFQSPLDLLMLIKVMRRTKHFNINQFFTMFNKACCVRLGLTIRVRNTSKNFSSNVFFPTPPSNSPPVNLMKRLLRLSNFNPPSGKIRAETAQRPSKIKNDMSFWLVVSTHLKNISQNGNLPQIGVKIKNV